VLNRLRGLVELTRRVTRPSRRRGDPRGAGHVCSSRRCRDGSRPVMCWRSREPTRRSRRRGASWA